MEQANGDSSTDSNNSQPQAENQVPADRVAFADEDTTVRDSPATVPPTPKKAPKLWLIPVIIGGVFAVLGGSASAYYFAVYQSPTNVLNDAMGKLLTADIAQAEGSVTINKDLSGVTIKSVSYGGKADSGPNGDVSVSAKLGVGDRDIVVGGKGALDKDGNLYFQLNNVLDVFKEYVRMQGATDEQMVSFYPKVERLQDQWVKVTPADLNLADSDQKTGDAIKCLIDTTTKHMKDNERPYIDMYKKHQFIEIKESLGTKDGRFGYRIGLNKDKYKSYENEAKNLPVSKELEKCSPSTDQSTTESDGLMAQDVSGTVKVWIDQMSHELRLVEYEGTGGKGSNTVTFSGNLNLKYDKSIRASIPSDTISLKEYEDRIGEIMGGQASI